MTASKHMAQPSEPHSISAERDKKSISMPVLALLLAGIFWGALILVFCIPVHLMKGNLLASEQIMESESAYPISYTTGISYDNFTVSIMLDEAATRSGNPIKDSVEARYYYDPDIVSTIAHSINNETNTSYSRYWHGYLVFLKPLLLFFNVHEIRLILQTALLVLLGLASIAFYRRWGAHGIFYAAALLLSMGLFGAADAAATLPIFSSFAIAAIGCFVLAWRDGWSDYDLRRFFFVIGAVTVYFDFLDNPVITLGLPLCVVLLLKYRSYKPRNLAMTLVQAILFWGLGYGIPWVAKWILAAIVLGPSAFGDAVSQLLFRTGATNIDGMPQTSASSAIAKNIAVVGKLAPLMGILLAVMVACVLAAALRARGKQRAQVIALGCGVFLVAILPFAWYCGASNHSDIHAGFLTYRDLIVTLCALLTGVSEGGILLCGQKSHMPESGTAER